MPVDRTQTLLRTESLTRKYGDHVALDSLNLTVHAGEVYGYIGPNGAGKTTTFRILCGLLAPTSGRAFVADQDVTGNKDLLKQRVGYLPDNFGVYPNLRVWEYLDFFAAAYRIAPRARPSRIDECLMIAEANAFRDKFMGALSRGMKQRVGIAKTLLHDPRIVILDEPAATIDPRARVGIRKLLRNLADLGKAVLVSSHILSELADVCDTVGILHSGKMVASGPVREILRKLRPTRLLEIQVRSGIEEARIALKEAPGEWRLIDGADDGMLRYDVTADEDQIAGALKMLIDRGVRVNGFQEVAANLEEVFMSLTGPDRK